MQFKRNNVLLAPGTTPALLDTSTAEPSLIIPVCVPVLNTPVYAESAMFKANLHIPPTL